MRFHWGVGRFLGLIVFQPSLPLPEVNPEALSRRIRVQLYADRWSWLMVFVAESSSGGVLGEAVVSAHASVGVHT